MQSDGEIPVKKYQQELFKEYASLNKRSLERIEEKNEDMIGLEIKNMEQDMVLTKIKNEKGIEQVKVPAITNELVYRMQSCRVLEVTKIHGKNIVLRSAMQHLSVKYLEQEVEMNLGGQMKKVDLWSLPKVIDVGRCLMQVVELRFHNTTLEAVGQVKIKNSKANYKMYMGMDGTKCVMKFVKR